MAKSKKASARVTAAKQSQAATSASARNKAGLQAIAKAAGQQTAGQQFEKTRARAIQSHIQARGQRKQAKRDSR